MAGFVDDTPSDDRSCAERGRDAVTGVADYVTRRLRHYRAAGELAMTFGWPVLRRKLVARAAAALTMRAPLDAGIPGAALRDAPPLGEFARLGSLTASGASEAPSSAPDPTAGNGAANPDHLAIPGYDSLSASQVVERLAGLPGHDLDEVRGYEAAHRNRRTILGKIDQLRSSAP